MKTSNAFVSRLLGSSLNSRFAKPLHTLCGTVLLLALAVAAASADEPQAKAAPFQIIDIQFADFSDGVHFVINNTNGVVTGSYTGSDSAQIVGVKTKIPKQKNSAAIVFRSQYDRIHVVRLDRKKTWTYYAPDGSVFNSGTWSNAPAIAIADDAKAALPSTNAER